MWVLVSKDDTKSSKDNYPVSVINKHLKNKFINYDQAFNYDFKEKNVILHCIWKHSYYKKWIKFLDKIKNESKNLWVEFDADDHLDKIYRLDKLTNICGFFYKTFKNVDKFIWEQPEFYNPFVRNIERIPLRFYVKSFEKDIKNNKDIDFFTFIDNNKNISETIDLFTELTLEGYKTHFLFLDKNLYLFYKHKLSFNVDYNEFEKFSDKSVFKFNNLLSRSKVFVDLSYRLTTGRVVYDAMYNGTIFVGTNTYGATNFLFPEYSLISYPVNLNLVYEFCKKAFNSWSKDYVINLRKEAEKSAGINNFLDELKSRSN